MSRRFNGLLKVCVFFAVFAIAATALPAAAYEPAWGSEDRDEEAMRSLFAASTTMGFIKGVQLLGGNKQITPEQVIRIYQIAHDTFPKILAMVKRAGLYDEYKGMFFDPEIRRLDAKSIYGRTESEMESLSEELVSYLQRKYPRLWKWLDSDEEMERISTRMFEKMGKVLE